MHVSVDAFEYFILSKIPPCMLTNAHRLTAFVYAIHIHLDTTLKGLQRLLRTAICEGCEHLTSVVSELWR